MRLLFVPVSGPYGMGEFARSSAIARAALERWPRASVHFLLSRAAPYAGSAEFPTTLLRSSATFHSAAVIDLIRAWRPHVVVFDNAGRTTQLRAAQASGARVVFISARRRQRRKAFRLSWMRLIDEHWIAYPKFIAGELGPLERLKLGLLRRPEVRYLDVIFSRGTRAPDAAGVAGAAGYVLVVPGGGTGHPHAAGALEPFRAAARALAAAGFETKFVGPWGATAPAGLTVLAVLPQSDLAALMRQARLIIANGGSTLLQAIACGAPCVAAPLARDQRERIRRCAQLGVAVEAAPDAADIMAKAGALLRDRAALDELARRAAALALADGVEVALRALEKFIVEAEKAS